MSSQPARRKLVEGPGGTLLLVGLALLLINTVVLAWLWLQPLAPLDQLPDRQPLSVTDPSDPG